MAVLSRRSTDAPANREAILAATVGLLADGTPYAEITIEQIVRAAGLSRPTFYSYFRDKRALVLELGGRLLERVAVAADPWLTEGEGHIRETLAAVLEAFRAEREALAALVEAATYDPEVNAFWMAFHERFQATAAARIRAADQELPEARVRARAFALVWMTERTITELLAGADIEDGALLDELALAWSLVP